MLLVGFGAYALVAALYLRHRSSEIVALYAEASGQLRFYRGSAESAEAARKLATYHGARVTQLLLALAIQNNTLSPEAQTVAIRALAERDDPRIAPALANLLQPQEGLNTRRVAASALTTLPCKGDCILSVLHYLERVWWGEPNYEDRWLLQRWNEGAVASLKADQKVLYSTLYSVLRRERYETLGALSRFYGLGTSNVSKFTLDLLPRLRIHEACPQLLQSDRQIKELSPDSYSAPRGELRAAIAALGCK